MWNCQMRIWNNMRILKMWFPSMESAVWECKLLLDGTNKFKILSECNKVFHRWKHQKICKIEYLWCEEQEKIFLVCLRSGIIWFGLHVHTMSRPPFPSMEYLIHLSKFFHRRKFVLTCFCWAVEIFPSTEYIYLYMCVWIFRRWKLHPAKSFHRWNT